MSTALHICINFVGFEQTFSFIDPNICHRKKCVIEPEITSYGMP